VILLTVAYFYALLSYKLYRLENLFSLIVQVKFTYYRHYVLFHIDKESSTLFYFSTNLVRQIKTNPLRNE